MKNLILIVAIACGPALAAERGHIWYHVDHATGKCRGGYSPQAMYDWLASAEGHEAGYTVDRIEPDDVIKDDDGNIRVAVTGTKDGQFVADEFFTKLSDCEQFIVTNRVAPQQAPPGDLN